ncbi:MerR family transcriptional regulator [Streptomyces sp. NA04227]|uniref:MerR family transcriptional regulator n=1 Tax=Streptomyces sp. NA04227 TaxID=2742136 RepID=UPI0015923687|nr:MerR family transcriptional regulator [Streptomyces sp. NA04227]QKW11304.1 MerR family transcriptional regulator [Streptomyces sp. NA04227]
MWSIGELAEQAGVTVKTVRFYSDRGLLPEATRSSGGHRRYGPEAVERLALIRSLRRLDLPVPEVTRVLDREDALEDVIAGQLGEIGSRLAELRWQEAALRLLQDCPPDERARRLRLVGALSTPPNTTVLARFWRRWLPARLPARVAATLIEHAVPQPPDDPAPGQVLAFAELHAFVSRPCPGTAPQPAAHRADEGWRPAVLYDGLGEAHLLAAPELRARRTPFEGEALDCFVGAYAAASGQRDTADFRRQLRQLLAADPRIDHYWNLVAKVSGPDRPTPGATHDWLLEALDTHLARAA